MSVEIEIEQESVMSENRNIGEIVAEDYRTASVFKSFGIDFCCRGNRTIQEACLTKGIAVEEVIVSLKKAKGRAAGTGIEDFNNWPLDLLVDLIVKRHHRYVQNAITEIKPLLYQAAEVHGDVRPELKEIKDLFIQGAGELTVHMRKEELLLFPFVRKLVAAENEDYSVPAPDFGTVESPVSAMMKEHENEGERFRRISELSSDYTAPAGACNTYRAAYALLGEFEEDLHLHIHIENNILFPKAVQLEKKLRQ